jgi:hypothetical protein
MPHFPSFKVRSIEPRGEKINNGQEFQSYLKASYWLDPLAKIELLCQELMQILSMLGFLFGQCSLIQVVG